MKNGKKVIYWDACIYITILEGDKKDQNLFDGAINSKNCLEKKECFLVASQMIILEVNKTTLAPDASKKFNEALRRSNVTRVAVGNRVIDLANELMVECLKVERSLKQIDAIHLATAIIYEVDEFYTNDIKLKKLNGVSQITKYKLPKICLPPLPEQTSLNLVEK